ncbi:unnamed protein product, partial [Leptidea sinapis]
MALAALEGVLLTIIFHSVKIAMGYARLLLFVYLVCADVVLCILPTDEIILSQGKLRGVKLNGYNAYLGVPYASVVKRYREAGPEPSWSGTFLAINGNIKCNQMLPIVNTPVGQEDCLVANIYTPSNTKARNLPVMVFIHGGGFYYGSNTNLLYDPKYLVQKDVIVVAINYRLGAFGFLCLNGTEATGNMGFKDQIASLRWINRNIETFGGDPNMVTLIGESAGATSVHYILLYEQAKGLFRRAILESGSILIPVSFGENPLDDARNFVSKLGSTATDPFEILKFMEERDATEIIKGSFVNTKNDIKRPYIFKPCAEDPQSQSAFITTSPRKLLKSAKLDPDVDVIIGFNDKEGIMFAGLFNTDGIRHLNNDFSRIIPRNLKFKNKEEKINFEESVKKFYFDNKPISSTNYSGLINYFTDYIMIYPAIESTETLLTNNLNVYNYLFAYDSMRNLNKIVSGLPFTPGANHADELFYIFDPIIYKLLPTLPNDGRI